MIQCIFPLTLISQPKVRANKKLRQLLEAYSQDMILLKRNTRQILRAKQNSINQFRHTTYPSMTSTATIVSISLLLTMDILEISKKLPDKGSSAKLTVNKVEGTKIHLLLYMSTSTKKLYLATFKINRNRRSLKARKMKKKKMTGQWYRSQNMMHLKLMKSSIQLLMNTACIRLTNRTLTSGILKRRVLRSTIVLKSTTLKKQAHIHTGRRTCMQDLRNLIIR